MHITKILHQNRRDFTADFACEHCGYTTRMSGYDDTYYHSQVIPNMTCKECGKKAGEEYRPLTTKYPEATQI